MPHHSTTIKMKGGTTKGEILKRGGFCKNNSHKNNNCSSFSKNQFLFLFSYFQNTVGCIYEFNTQSYLTMVPQEKKIHKIYIIGAIPFPSNVRNFMKKKFIYHEMTYIVQFSFGLEFQVKYSCDYSKKIDSCFQM